MKRSFLLGTLFLAASCSVSVSVSARAQEAPPQFDGFHVDVAQIGKADDKDAVLSSIQKQVDIVEKVGLSREDLGFFKSVPIVVMLDVLKRKGQEEGNALGQYSGKTRSISLGHMVLDPNKPILLHEMLHAYHNQKLPQGFANPEVKKFYLRAKDVYANQDAYFLKNPQEFFAVTASIYLFGDITRAPFTRERIQQKQPLYYKYLATLFGERDDKKKQ